MEHRDSINGYILQSITQNWEEQALTDINGISYSYKDIGRKITKLHILFDKAGLKRGDKVALCGKNSSQWAVAFLGVVTYGCVAVPILHEFKPDTIHHLVNHSDSRLLFTDATIWENLDPASMKDIIGAIRLTDFSLLECRNKHLEHARTHLNELFGQRFPERFTAADVQVIEENADDLALINYTSGSTGFSKGVMLSYRALWSNLQFCIDGLTFLKPTDGIVCMLPLAHMYGLMVELLHPFVKGCHIYFLTRMPSPRVIMDAFARVRPKLIVSVPLIIEKIIKTRVFPLLDKPLMKILLHVPFVDDHLLQKIKAKLTDTFGGRLQEMIIGGAGLNKEVDTFLRRIGFPFTVGYGMTECGPLVSYAPWNETKPGSCGRIVPRMEARVDSPDPVNEPGVISVKGDNVMMGYFKNPEATAEALSEDGWLNTGDIGVIDSDGFIFLRGRDKNMILGPSGQNIYPEEIEQKLNNMPYVGESIVISEGDKLVALIHPDTELVAQQGMSEADVERQMADNIAALNKEIPAYAHVSRFKLMSEEFEKTPKRSIKRFLYQHS